MNRKVIEQRNEKNVVVIGCSFEYEYLGLKLNFVVTSITNSMVIATADKNDWGIVERPFSINEVKNRITWVEVFEEKKNLIYDFWNQQEVGQIVHYYSDFNQFIRGEVVLDEDSNKVVKYIALLGDWKKRDLPKRNKSGIIEPGYYAEMVRSEKVSTPSPEKIWEAMTESERKNLFFNKGNVMHEDPYILEPVDLTVPDMTDIEKREALLEVLFSNIQSAIFSYKENNESKLATIKNLIIKSDQICQE